jgi:anti-anti-sigma factor
MFSYKIDEKIETDRLVVVSLRGVLDSKKALDFYEYILGLENQFSRYIINCDELVAISSSGISILLRIRKRFIQKNFIPILTGFNSELQDLFHFFGFNKLFYVTKNIGAAKNILRTMHPIQTEVSFEEIQPIPILKEERDLYSDLEEISTSPDISLKEEKYVPMFLSEASVPGVGIELDQNTSIESNKMIDYSVENKKDFEFTIPFITRSNDLTEEDIKDSIIIEEEHRGYQEKFTELLINCGNCKTKIKIKKQGRQKCPTCGAAFLLRQSGSISTIEKL